MSSETDSNNLELQPLHFLLLLAQILRSSNIANLAFRQLEPAHIRTAGGLTAHSILYLGMQLYYKEHQQCPDEAALDIHVTQFCEKYATGKPALIEEVRTVFTELMRFTRTVESRSEPLTAKIIATIAKRCIHTPAINELLNDALVRQTITGLGKQFLEAEAQMAAASGGSSVNNISTIPEVEAGSRVTTGIPWLDSRMGRGQGPVLGGVIGIIAGQAVGKTSLGIQLGVAQALQQRHVLLVLAEEGLSKTVKRRIMACTTGIPTTGFEDAKDNIEVAIAKYGNGPAIRERVAAIDKYLHVLDLVNKPGDLATIIAEIDNMRMSGRRLTYVYVDWAGPLADRMMSLGYNGQKFQKRYDALKLLGAELNLTASRSDTIIAVSHQMTAVQFKRGAFAEADHYCAMDCNSFTETFKYVLVINPRDTKTGVSWLKMAKSRDDDYSPSNTKIMVRLKGEMSQFFDVTNDYTAVGKSFKLKGGPKPGEIPKEDHAK